MDHKIMRSTLLGASMAFVALATTPALAVDPSLSACADLIDTQGNEISYRVDVDMGDTSSSRYARMDIVAFDGTGVYYPQLRNQSITGDKRLWKTNFVVDTAVSSYPLTFFVAGFTKAGLDGWSAACRKRENKRSACFLTGTEPGIDIFGAGQRFHGPRWDPLCRDSRQRRQTGDPERLMLVIGNARYGVEIAPGMVARRSSLDKSDLANSMRDAGAVGDALAQVQFSAPYTNSDLSLGGMTSELQKLSRLARESPTGTEVIFYYAGHGFSFAGETWLLPVNATLPDRSLLAGHDVASARAVVAKYATPLSEVLAAMPANSDHFNLIILDMCRDNPWGDLLEKSAEAKQLYSAPDGSLNVARVRNTIIAYSAGAGRSVPDASPGGSTQSPYTQILVDVIRSHSDWPVRAMIDEVTRRARLLKPSTEPVANGELDNKSCIGTCGVS